MNARFPIRDLLWPTLRIAGGALAIVLAYFAGSALPYLKFGDQGLILTDLSGFCILSVIVPLSTLLHYLRVLNTAQMIYSLLIFELLVLAAVLKFTGFLIFQIIISGIERSHCFYWVWAVQRWFVVVGWLSGIVFSWVTILAMSALKR
jgi:hypothetical protein